MAGRTVTPDSQTPRYRFHPDERAVDLWYPLDTLGPSQGSRLTSDTVDANRMILEERLQLVARSLTRVREGVPSRPEVDGRLFLMTLRFRLPLNNVAKERMKRALAEWSFEPAP